MVQIEPVNLKSLAFILRFVEADANGEHERCIHSGGNCERGRQISLLNLDLIPRHLVSSPDRT